MVQEKHSAYVQKESEEKSPQHLLRANYNAHIPPASPYQLQVPTPSRSTTMGTKTLARESLGKKANI